MKLIIKFTLLFLLISLGVFFIGGVITYQIVKREIDLEQERFLEERLGLITQMIEKRHPDQKWVRDKIMVQPLGSGAEETEIAYSDTLVMHSTLGRMEPHIKLDVVRKIQDKFYQISLYDLIVEEDDIVESVRESMIKFYLLLTVVVLVLGGVSSMYLLKPFNRTLAKIKSFHLDQEEPIHFTKSGTQEFDKLNKFLTEMTQKVQTDYRSLREFAENASHEMQTPITNAIGKLELLLASGNIPDAESPKVIAALDSIKHLSKMGQSLNLLTKIDNREFQKIENVNFSEALEQAIDNFHELMELKSISFDQQIKNGVKVNMDSTLTRILINNLMSNAIRHNQEHGTIRAKLDEQAFILCNSGPPLTVTPSTLFERFKKQHQRGDGLGLGLAIVKKICDVSGFKVNYHFEMNEHRLEINFN